MLLGLQHDQPPRGATVTVPTVLPSHKLNTTGTATGRTGSPLLQVLCQLVASLPASVLDRDSIVTPREY